MSDITYARNATLSDLAELLKSQQARKLDIVAPATSIRAHRGALVVSGIEPQLDEHGVTQLDGSYVPTAVCDEGIAEKLRIPLAYVRRMRAERPDLWDANVNGWLHGRRRNVGGETVVEHPADDRKFLLRCFRGDEFETGVARAFLSDRYGFFDHLDGLTAALDGIARAGVHVEVVGCDLTERRMRVRIAAPEVHVLAPAVLGRYRDPFAGADDRTAAQLAAHGWLRDFERETVFAGFELTNSETGGGAWQLAPRVLFRVCSNGLVVGEDALRTVHVGSKLDDGIVRWSVDTLSRNAELIAAKSRDAVETLLSAEYVQSVLDRIEAKGARPIAPTEAQHVVETVGRRLSYTDDQIASVLGMFVAGGDLTSLGVMQAVTAAAQLVDDAETAAQMEADALRALDFAVTA
jgi:hypothetical protein